MRLYLYKNNNTVEQYLKGRKGRTYVVYGCYSLYINKKEVYKLNINLDFNLYRNNCLKKYILKS